MEKPTNHKEQLNEIYQKFENGNIATIEAIQKSNTLTAQIATAEAVDGANRLTQEVFAQGCLGRAF